MANLSFCVLSLGCVNYRSREQLQCRWTAGQVSHCGSMLLKDSLLQAASELAVCVCLIRAWIPHLLDCRGAEDMFQLVTKVWCPMLSSDHQVSQERQDRSWLTKVWILPSEWGGGGLLWHPPRLVSSPVFICFCPSSMSSCPNGSSSSWNPLTHSLLQYEKSGMVWVQTPSFQALIVYRQYS